MALPLFPPPLEDAEQSVDGAMINDPSLSVSGLLDSSFADSSLSDSSLSAPLLTAATTESVRLCIQGARVALVSYGCSHNMSDGEYMAGQLAAYGFLITSEEDADLVVLNSCTVKGPSQDAFLSKLRAVHRSGKKVVVAGCVPQADRFHLALKEHSVVGVQAIDQIVPVVEQTLRGVALQCRSTTSMPSLHLPKVRRNRFVEIVPINLGCLGSCTYCMTKYSRGKLRSYAPQDILHRIKDAVVQGVTQIWLTSEDCGAYGRDIGTDLPSLVEQILDVIPSHVMLRIGMTNPPFIREHVQRVIALLNHPRVFSFLHIPVQSGSDAVLGAMRREYTVAEFQFLVDTIREGVPGVSIATDIICGFPTERVADEIATQELVQRNVFPILNISQFYPRPYTAASRLKRLPTQEVKRRSTELTRIFKSQLPYCSLLGRVVRVWLLEVSANACDVVGHTKSYVTVLVKRNDTLLGTCADVRIVQAGKHFVRGIIAV